MIKLQVSEQKGTEGPRRTRTNKRERALKGERKRGMDVLVI